MNNRPAETATIACAKCHRSNEAGATQCTFCGERLHTKCGRCGHPNERSRRTCVKCGKGLHASSWRRWRHKLSGRRKKVKPVYVLLAVLLVFVLGYWLPKYLASLDLDSHSQGE